MVCWGDWRRWRAGEGGGGGGRERERGIELVWEFHRTSCGFVGWEPGVAEMSSSALFDGSIV